jgi:hypothetical protein
MALSTVSKEFHPNITFNATQNHISRVEISATQTRTSTGANNRWAGKLADSCTTALALSLSLALILACLSERKAGQLTCTISRYQIVPTYLKTPSYFGLMIPLRAMHSRQLSLTLPMFRETCNVAIACAIAGSWFLIYCKYGPASCSHSGHAP